MTTVRYLSEDDVKRELALLEAKHGMTTAEFVAKYRAGKTNHGEDDVRWMGLWRMAQDYANSKDRLKSR